MNLLKETIEVIKWSGHSPDDIIFIGSEVSGHSCTWEEFKILANREYDDGFGAQEVATDLVIVFSDGTQMRRDEYDGSESWEYLRPFKMPEKTKPISRLFGGGWDSLEDIHEDIEA